MAQFRATIQGQRGEASRLGSKASGIQADVNGWHAGIRVYADVDSEGRDVFRVFATKGNRGPSYNQQAAVFRTRRQVI